MIQKGTKVNVNDNSGVKTLKCFHIYQRGKKEIGIVGDIIVGSVTELNPNILKTKYKKGDILRAIIVNTKKDFSLSKTGIYGQWNINGCILLDIETREPLHNRVFTSVPRKLRKQGYTKLISIVPIEL